MPQFKEPKTNRNMNVNDFKYSYNKFYKIYRVQLFEHGKWQKCTYDKKNFEFVINNNLKTNEQIRNLPYKPYLLYRIKWFFMNLWKWIKKTDPKLQLFVKSGFVIIILYLLTQIPNIIKSISQDNNQLLLKEMLDKQHKIEYLQTFSDSLLTEIKQKELKLKEYEQAQKNNSTKILIDSLKPK